VTTTTATDLWAEAVGQEGAAAQLRASAANPVHAYLLLGHEGWGARAVAAAFAADVLSAGLDDAGAERVRSLVAAGNFADFQPYEPEGAAIRVPDVQEITRLAYRAPTEAARKVILIPRLHVADPQAWSAMLKVIEEPPASTVWLLLADDLPTEMTTIASRSVTVPLVPVSQQALTECLQREGAGSEEAATASLAAAGDVTLARLLVSDERLKLRVAAWRRVPEQLDGSGHAVWRLVGEVRAAIDDSLAHVKSRFDAAEAELAARIEEAGLPKGQLRTLVESHKRQLRRARTAELRLGLATLGARYRDAIAVAGGRPNAHRRALLDAVGAIDETYEALAVRNANEALQLQALLLRLPSLA
jgi:DNA polymerase-3 subunit delta'